MQTISDSVGYKGKNNPSDVALVQAILLKTPCMPEGNNTKAKSYLAAYDAECSESTLKAIREFQGDYVNVTPDGRQCAPNLDAADALVRPGDVTWRKLLEKVDPNFSNMRILEGGKTVYLEASAQQLANALADSQNYSFATTFRPKIVSCINRMHAKSGIAITVCHQGGRRTFQEQQDILSRHDGATHAGPGESNRDFGMAADLGFKGLQWLKKDGSVQREQLWWLEPLSSDRGAAEALKFWQVLRTVGTSEVGLFRGPESDRPHLQNWDDHGVDMANRLADLMTRFGAMRWQGRHQRYSCDFGLGGDFYSVGTASAIWDDQGTVTAANLALARTAAQTRRQPQPHVPRTSARVAEEQRSLSGPPSSPLLLPK